MKSFTYSTISSPATESRGPIYRSTQCPKGEIVESVLPEVKTLYDVFQRGRSISGDNPCYGYRPIDKDGSPGDFIWISYNEAFERAQNFASGLLHLELLPVRHGYRCLGVLSVNRVEWVLCEQAANAYTFALVPLYDALGPDLLMHIMKETEMNVVACSKNQTAKILSLVEQERIPLTAVIQFEPLSDGDREAASMVNIKLYDMASIEKIGQEHRAELSKPSPTDVCTISYTSGTTGLPKGVLMTHRNLVSCLGGCMATGIGLTPQSRYLSYLPLAHVLERILHAASLHEGGRIGFFQGTTKSIMQDIAALRPTVFTSVPRLLNKVYESVMASMKQRGGISLTLFNWGLEAKKKAMQKGYNYHWFYDRMVFSKIREKIGLENNVLTISGSAPLSAEVMDFLRCLLGNVVVEGYGTTETSSATTLQVGFDFTSGNIGGPTPCCEAMLAPVPEMGYLPTDTEHNHIPCLGRGELCLRGHNITPGYFRHPEITEKVFDSEGFYHSGDIAIVLPNGSFKIVDRKSNIFKLSQGEFVAAESLELIYNLSPLIDQIYVHGNSFRSFLVAIAVANTESVTKFAATVPKLASLSAKEVCASIEFKQEILKSFADLAKENKLKGYERIRDVIVETEPWTPDNGLLTPTFKLKRSKVQQIYQEALNTLYDHNTESSVL